MKVGLLIQNNLWFCPYVNIYVELLEKFGIDYDYIFWNRDNQDVKEGIVYNGGNAQGKIGKLWGYFKYSQFLKKVINEKQYDRLIVFSPQIGIFLSEYLKKNYSQKYIFDYRDLSIEQLIFLKKPFQRLLDNSFSNVISSPGFKKCLPESNYLISHNFIVSEVRKALKAEAEEYNKNNAEILTIGGIRDFESNSLIIEALSNKNGFSLNFVGRGNAQQPLSSFAKSLGTENISFKGYYQKVEEAEIIKKATFLNIFYPDKISHSTALSNRFYNSLIYRRPMIVTKGQIQGDYVEKYNVGIAISDTTALPELLKSWMKHTDYDEYQNNCIALLKLFLDDYDIFENKIREFVDVR